MFPSDGHFQSLNTRDQLVATGYYWQSTDYVQALFVVARPLRKPLPASPKPSLIGLLLCDLFTNAVEYVRHSQGLNLESCQRLSCLGVLIDTRVNQEIKMLRRTENRSRCAPTLAE